MDHLAKKLEFRKKNNSFRELHSHNNYENHYLTDFFSNDYLGLASNIELHNLINEAYLRISNTRQHRQVNGSTGSRLLSGNSAYIEEIEDQLSSFFKGKALIFNSGYNANLGILSSVPQKGDTVLLDGSVHASLKEGVKLSHAKKYTFRHNDLEDLERKIKISSGNVYVVIESIYSMDGDFCPLETIVELCEKYNAKIILDEAHSTGIIGYGNGLACKLDLHNKIFARIYTFGKAIGQHGACIVGSKNLIKYLINFSRSFIYTTALPLHSICSIATAFNYLIQNIHLIDQLNNKIELYDNLTGNSTKLNTSYNFRTPIKVVYACSNDNAKDLSHNLQKEGLDVRPILSPTVKEGSEMVRICLHVYNTTSEINKLVTSIESNKNLPVLNTTLK